MFSRQRQRRRRPWTQLWAYSLRKAFMNLHEDGSVALAGLGHQYCLSFLKGCQLVMAECAGCQFLRRMPSAAQALPSRGALPRPRAPLTSTDDSRRPRVPVHKVHVEPHCPQDDASGTCTTRRRAGEQAASLGFFQHPPFSVTEEWTGIESRHKTISPEATVTHRGSCHIMFAPLKSPCSHLDSRPPDDSSDHTKNF